MKNVTLVLCAATFSLLVLSGCSSAKKKADACPATASACCSK